MFEELDPPYATIVADPPHQKCPHCKGPAIRGESLPVWFCVTFPCVATFLAGPRR